MALSILISFTVTNKEKIEIRNTTDGGNKKKLGKSRKKKLNDLGNMYVRYNINMLKKINQMYRDKTNNTESLKY